jgi:hypothetical protein
MSDSAKGSTRFPAAQRARLEALFPEYEDYIRKHNPEFKGTVEGAYAMAGDDRKELPRR